MVQLNDDLVRQLDDEASRRGVSRSAVIRRAITEMLAATGEDTVTRAIVDGYRRIPQNTPDAWGDLSRQVDSSNRETLVRLDEEERSAGMTWT